MSTQNNSDRLAVRSATAELRTLIEQERITEARELLSEALKGHSEDPEMLGLKAILAPPTATPIQIQDVDRSQELQWIAANRKAYRGRWVAVQGSKLVADAASFRDLQRRVKELEGEPPPLVHHL